jgi:hypothetical protein
VAVQARAIASSDERQYHDHAERGAGVNKADVLNEDSRPGTGVPTIAEHRTAVKYRAHFSLTGKHFSSITG